MEFEPTQAAPTESDEHVLPIRFTGSGSEYFRIWIVNLLLIVVTLGLYLPFAKRRRIAYFYANTEVGGHALAFHGDAWRMFRGFILLAVLMLVYVASGQFSPMVGLVSFVLLCAMWPALWRAGLRFRLAHTSWRGLRMGFTGDLAGAYRTVLPIYLPMIALVALGTLMPPEQGAQSAEPPGGWLVLLLPLLIMLGAPLALAATKRYQHNGYRLGSQRSRITLTTRSVYALCARTALVGLLAALALGALTWMALVAWQAGTDVAKGKAAVVIAFGVGMVLAYAMTALAAYPYFIARLQNLVWNATSSDAISLRSQLRFRSVLGLTLKNMALIVLTLGLYRPFAVVAMARLRLEAVTVVVLGSPEALLADAAEADADATGEAAGDFFGIDLGL